MITGIAEINDPCIPKVVKEITKIPWSDYLTGTIPPPQEGSMILRGREPISINPGVRAGKIMITALMNIDHKECWPTPGSQWPRGHVSV
jgi:hypothetical protein